MANKKKLPDASFIERMTDITEKVGGQNALSRLSGVPQTTISAYLKGGEPGRPQLVALAKGAGVPLEWLAMGADEQNSTTITKSNNVIAGEINKNTDTQVTQTYTTNLTAPQGSGQIWKLSAKEERFIKAIRKIGENPFIDEMLERAEAAAKALSW